MPKHERHFMVHRYLLATYKSMVSVLSQEDAEKDYWSVEPVFGKNKHDHCYVKVGSASVFLSPATGLYADVVKRVKNFRMCIFPSYGAMINVRSQVPASKFLESYWQPGCYRFDHEKD